MKPFNVLFLCTGNSARSIMAEAYLNSDAKGRFVAYSAGSHPQGAVNRFALDLLTRRGIDTSRLRSKGWDEYARPGAPVMDFVLTVCDHAAGEVCPLWPGRPITAHWGVNDPARVEGSDEVKRCAFSRAYDELSARVDRLLALPLENLGRAEVASRLADIGRHPVDAHRT